MQSERQEPVVDVSLDPAVSSQSQFDADHRSGMEDADLSVPLDDIVQPESAPEDGDTFDNALD